MAECSSNPKPVSQEITYEKILKEINDIENQLDLNNLHSLLGCARGLLKSQIIETNT